VLPHRVFAVVRRLLPAPLASRLRAAATAVIAPWAFSWKSGHFRSSLASRAMDRYGRPIPWYTYPAIEFLSDQDYSTKTVLEFGAGQSTLWWGARAREVLAVETDVSWIEDLSRSLPANVTLARLPLTLDGIDEQLGRRVFDIVVIDGLDRLRAARTALERVSSSGMVILDDSEGFWGPTGTHPILDLFRSAGLRRVDFYGPAPGVLVPHCTSVAFRDGCCFVAGQTNPRRLWS
jgi:hypothetical protein